MGDRIAQLILERIDTPPVQEVQDLAGTERGIGGFGSTGIGSGEKNDIGCTDSGKMNETGQKEQKNEQNENEVKGKTLKGRIGRFSGTRPTRTTQTEMKKTEGSSRLSHERQIISVKQLKKLVKRKTPVFLAVVWGQETRGVNAAVKSESIGLTEGKKRDLMRKTGPKRNF